VTLTRVHGRPGWFRVEESTSRQDGAAGRLSVGPAYARTPTLK
jgi:hypothetical protein